jgi:hypothetical protein
MLLVVMSLTDAGSLCVGAGSAGAARAQGPGAAAGADPRAGGAAPDGGHPARPRVADEDPGPAPLQGRRPRPPGGARRRVRRRRRLPSPARPGALRRRGPRKSIPVLPCPASLKFLFQAVLRSPLAAGSGGAGGGQRANDWHRRIAHARHVGRRIV